LGELNGVYYAVLDPLRLGFYSGLEYVREKEAFQTIPLGRLFKELGLIIDEPPREKTSLITMSDALNLGRGKLIIDAYNREVNRYVEREFGVDVI
jgi:arginine deiminase